VISSDIITDANLDDLLTKHVLNDATITCLFREDEVQQEP